MERLFTKNDIHEAANWCWDQLGDARLLALHGVMGAGKTTLVHAMCEVRGVKDVVSSPTFSIINEYGYEENGKRDIMYHIDLYRLKDEQEAMLAGVEECLYSGHICLVEWPEKAPGLFPSGTIHVYLEVYDTEIRRLVISGK